jgi:hypothetical protein
MVRDSDRPRLRVQRRWRLAGSGALGIALLVGMMTFTPDVAAQGWWPWATPSAPPPPPVPRPSPRDPAFRPPPPGQGYVQPRRGGQASGICLQLEQRLAQESQRGAVGRDALPRIDAELRAAERQARVAANQLERYDCFEQFLFQRTLRRTRQCIDFNRQQEAARRQIAELDAQRQQIAAGSGRSHQDDIIRELARHNCGSAYQQEASRRGNPFSSLWQDEDSGPRGDGNSFGSLPFATYRTLCVRLCDGYYFPVSFSTLPNHFSRDADVCEQRCAAPAELYYHQNPGGEVEQMVSAKTQQPYTALRSAFRYRKEYVNGCSCKKAEYEPALVEDGRRADAGAGAPAPAATPRVQGPPPRSPLPWRAREQQ